MRSYWDERAKENAPWYVDTSLDYEHPDMERFFADGRRIVGYAFDDSPVVPPRYGVALEIGCGLGRVCLGLSERFERVLGLDISVDMGTRARKLVPDPRVSFIVGDGSSLGMVRDGSVEAVFSFTVFQHIPSIKVIETYIEEAGRVLSPGGMFVFQWNNTGASLWWAWRRRLLGALRRVGISRDSHERDAAAFLGSRVSMRRITAALERAGMDLHHVKNAETLYAFAWAVRRTSDDSGLTPRTPEA
jgi:SAM-dependent methyltransferase